VSVLDEEERMRTWRWRLCTAAAAVVVANSLILAGVDLQVRNGRIAVVTSPAPANAAMVGTVVKWVWTGTKWVAIDIMVDVITDPIKPHAYRVIREGGSFVYYTIQNERWADPSCNGRQPVKSSSATLRRNC
jgi:hypothetical protein